MRGTHLHVTRMCARLCMGHAKALAGDAMYGRIALLASILLLASCASMRPAVVHEPVTVTRYVYVPISRYLTDHPGDIPSPHNSSGEELLRVARARKGDLLKCYGKLDSIESVQGTEVTVP